MSRRTRRRNGKMRDKKTEQIEFLQEIVFSNNMAQLEGPKKKKWTYHDLQAIQPLTQTQKDMFEAFFQGDHIVAYGSAGTGKTFVALFLAMSEILDRRFQDRLIIVRSVVPTREMGHLPGTKEEKEAPYEQPYRDMFASLFHRESTYDDMKAAGLVEFVSTSHVRGLTWDNAIVLIDEFQNMTMSEIDSVITRIGDKARVVLCGDIKDQCDLRREQTGAREVIKVAENMNSFTLIKFTRDDIVRSGFVRDWITSREELDI